MRILHVSPTYFDDQSFIGGGERYAYELAKAMAAKEEVVFLSFAPHRASDREGSLRIEHIRRHPLFRNRPLFGNPVSPTFFSWIGWADVIHCHQVHTLSTDLAIMLGRVLGKKVFVTDLGGGHKYAPSYYIPLLKWSDGCLHISQYSKRLWQSVGLKSRPECMRVIYGGVDTQKFSPGIRARSNTPLFVGRLLPHKGVDYLIEAVGGGIALDIVGRIYHPGYFDLLKTRGQNKSVSFYTDIDDQGLVKRYREALVTVLPSVYENCYGDRTHVPELLGLVALESLACGTPVILTDVGALPEIIEDGTTGFLVPPNNPRAIREKIEYLQQHPEVAVRMGNRGREMVLKRFTWDAVADRCLMSYRC